MYDVLLGLHLLSAAGARGSESPADLAPVLREAVRTGDFAEFGLLLADEAVLDTSNETGRRRIEGREAILAHVAGTGPGEVADWHAREWPTGAAITFEWRGSTVDRRRWYIRRSGDEVVAISSYAARPRTDRAEPAPQVPQSVLDQLGPGARREELAHGGNSGAALESIVTADGKRLVAKRVGAGTDWLGRVTRDRGRTALLWEHGAFGRMPGVIDHGIETVAREGDGWWVVMRDLSHTFLGDERRISREESRRVLGAAAAMHREFADDLPDGATALVDRLGMASLPVAEQERTGPDLLPKQLEAAWDAFADSVPDGVATEILSAVRDPAPLASALEATGRLTLIHGDLRDDNLGLTDDGIVLIDWDLATAGTPTVEFAWFLCHDAWRTDASHDELEADFLAAEGDVDPRERELGILSGLVQYGWIFGHSLRVHPDPVETAWAQWELDWWVPRTQRALESAGGMAR